MDYNPHCDDFRRTQALFFLQIYKLCKDASKVYFGYFYALRRRWRDSNPR